MYSRTLYSRTLYNVNTPLVSSSNREAFLESPGSQEERTLGTRSSPGWLGWAIIGLMVAFKIFVFILLHDKFLQFDWLRAVVFQLNLK